MKLDSTYGGHSATAMAKRKTKTRRKKRKSEAVIKRKAKVVAVFASKTAGHSPEATAANKKAMIKALGVGMNPGDAAEAIGVGRSTVFNWKKDDPEFSAAWDEARETAWDRAETKMYELGMDGNVIALKEALRANRPEKWRETRSESTSTLNTNFHLKMTLEESQERLKQLGIVMPMYEGDQDEDHMVPLIEDKSEG